MILDKIDAMGQRRRNDGLLAAFLLASLLVWPPCQAFAQPTLSDGLVAWYPFDGNANDLGPNGYNGTIYGAVPDADRIGSSSSSLKFTGTTNWVRLNIGPSVFANDFTVGVWIKADDLQANYATVVAGDTGCIRFYVNGPVPTLVPGTIAFYQYVPPPSEPNRPFGEMRSAKPIETNQWYHLAAVKSGSNYRLYTNGVLSAETTDTGPALTGSFLQVGNDFAVADSQHYFHGNVDDLRIYNRALTTNEIQSLLVAQVVITNQPINALMLPGGTATFSVGALGPPPLFYQWRVNSTNMLAGQTNDTLTISNVQPADIGIYSVVVSSSDFSVISSSAFLTIITPGIDDDGDGLSNTDEARFGSNPNNPDSDGDGLSDYDELFVYGTDPLKVDTDGDGIPDKWEIDHGLNPRFNDANVEIGSTGVSNWQLYQYDLTHPKQTDQLDPRNPFFAPGTSIYEATNNGQHTNRFYYDHEDRLIGAEYSRGISIGYKYDGNGNLTNQATLPRSAETNGLPVLWRYLNGIPTNRSPYTDSDGDGWSDYQEWKAGSNPLDPNSLPNLLGDPGMNIASLSRPFTPSNFVVGVGQLDGVGAEEVVVGTDGDPGTNVNFLLVLTQNGNRWSTQRVDVGTFGITSIAVGQVANRPAPAIYAGLRQAGGTGRLVEFISTGGIWQTNLIALSTNEAALVVGLYGPHLLASLALTNTPVGTLCSAFFLTNWTLQVVGTNTSNRGLGTVARSRGNQTLLRLLDSGQIEAGALGSTFLPEAINRPGTESWYALTPSPMTWSNAQAYAQQYGADLATIETPAESDWLTNAFSAGDLFIGFYRPQGSYWPDGRWISGLPSNFLNWTNGEPTYIPGREASDGRYTVMIFRPPFGTWNDVNDADGLFRGLLETRPQPDPLVIPEPGGSNIRNWRGVSLASGLLRAGQPTNGSIIYAFTDDKNGNGIIDFGDDFVIAEYLVNGTNATQLTLSRQPIDSIAAAQSCGLVSLNFLNSGNDVFFTGEPDGQLFAWTATGATNPLQRQLFSANYFGKAWHALAGVKTLNPGEGLVGLLVDPRTSNSCDVVFWPTRQSLPALSEFPQTAPLTRILPDPSSGKGVAKVRMRIWDAEGNASIPFLQYQRPATSNWMDATIVRIDGTNFNFTSRFAALPGGSDHELLWNAALDLGIGFTNAVLLRARSHDVALLGDWSDPVVYQLATVYDSDGDGLPDAWELVHNLDPLNAAGINGASGDADGDGFSNWAEYIADTDPRDPASYLRVTAVHGEQNGIRIDWSGGVQSRQILEKLLQPGAANSLWFNVYTNLPPTPTTGSYLDLFSTNVSSWYRIRAQRP